MSNAPDLARVRNIGIAAHVDAGKTTLTERILYYAGVSHKIGEVHEGAAHMDYMAEEQAHGITITAAVTRLPWREHLIQLIDTPGHVDFTIEVERSMRVLDGCIIVLDGVRGVEPQTETVWRQRTRFRLPALFFVNKLDRPGADFSRALATVRERLGAEPVAVTVPLPDYDGTIIHLIDKTRWRFAGGRGEQVDISPCDEAVWEQMRPWRESLLLAAAEMDDVLAEQVLAEEEPDPDAVWAALRQAALAGKVFPCFAGSALRNQGVQPVMDSVLRLLPAPTERPPSLAHRPNGNEEWVAMEADGPLAALAFKVQMWEGRRHVFARIYRGMLKPGDDVAIPGPEGTVRHERAARLFEVDANHKIRLDQAAAGQIVLIAGLRWATTGDTLCAPSDPLWLERIETREPVLGLAIEPQSSADEEKLLEALDKLQQEDPTLRVEEDQETGQRVLRGMGELHLQIAGERLQREFHVNIRVGNPDVVTRETIEQAAEADHLFHRVIEQPDSKKLEMKAGARVAAAPLPRGAGLTVTMEPVVRPEGAQLNPLQKEAISSGAEDGLANGPATGAPLQDLAVRVLEVELSGALSSPQALRIAVAEAVRKALIRAGGRVLRPVMTTEVVVPESDVGMVMGDLQARRAVIRDTTSLGDMTIIHCDCALDRLLGYITDLRGMTHGRGQFTMTFDRFDAV
ncbi:MAG: GTP-binding protein [Candidatus Competibacteraceae bacterium]|nr:GTP-binding protein [Candidatus Competibacteraceae bacterium]MCP5134862.1 GTP-binding protein [Gammaproteobacteria bacterium]